MKILIVSITLILSLLLAAFIAYTYKPQLTKLHESIETTYRNVAHIDAQIFSKLNTDKLVVFDVREPNEFADSHLAGAVLVDPNISALEFERSYGDTLEDKTVVFYCSVGKRSSALAAALSEVLIDNGASNSYNLIGGIFQWRNDSRPLVQANGIATTKVHPYNKYWARYISNKKAISYSPIKS